MNSDVASVGSSRLGNTRAVSREKKYKNWCFTLNNYTEQEINALLAFLASSKQYVFQEEEGEEKTPHLQGCVQFKNQTRFSTISKINPRIHWEHCRSWKHACAYCSDEDKRKPNGRIWNKGVIIIEKLKDPLQGKELHPWQKDILDIIKKEPHDRTIHWYYEYEGNVGKTSLAKHICMNYPALYVSGGAKDIKYAIAEYVKTNNLKVAIFDIPRDKENYMVYSALEEVKNGIFFSPKYEAGMVMFNTPHVIVFANFHPQLENTLSQDRWHIVNLALI